MDAIECMKTRRSIRKFEQRPVPRELIMGILDCARHAPSAMNSQPWLFFVIEDAKKKQALATLKKTHPAPWLVDAPVVIAVCVDIGKSRTRWVEDGSIAASHILLAAHALGLGACWVGMRFEDTTLNARIQQALGVEGSIFPICLVALGYPAETPAPKELKRLHEVAR